MDEQRFIGQYLKHTQNTLSRVCIVITNGSTFFKKMVAVGSNRKNYEIYEIEERDAT